MLRSFPAGRRGWRGADVLYLRPLLLPIAAVLQVEIKQVMTDGGLLCLGLLGEPDAIQPQ